MLSSICPFGERARNRAWAHTTVAYVLGSLLGGLVLGGLAAVIGGFVPAGIRGSSVVLGAIALVFLLGLVVDWRSRGSVPSWHRQVDEVWLTRYRGWVYGFGFGAQLGFGLVTIVTSTTTYATIVLAALSGSLPTGLLIGATFGLARAVPSVLMWRVHSRTQLNAVFGRIETWAPRADALARAMLVTGSIVLLYQALSPMTPEA